MNRCKGLIQIQNHVNKVEYILALRHGVFGTEFLSHADDVTPPVSASLPFLAVVFFFPYSNMAAVWRGGAGARHSHAIHNNFYH